MYDTVMIVCVCIVLVSLAFGLGVATAEKPSMRWMRIATRLCRITSVLAVSAMFALTVAQIAIRIFAS